MNSYHRFPAFFHAAILPAIVAWSFAFAGTTGAVPPAKTFASPEDAVRALTVAVSDRDTNALAAMFGPQFSEVQSPDPVQAENELTEFAANLNASNHLARVSDGRCVIETGEEWPFPIPLVRKDGAWFFDTGAGKDEIINRRIGRNELDVLKSVRAYADAQREYASKDHDGDEVLEYAQKLVSSPGMKEGLYWSPDIDGEISPLGPAFVVAHAEGYFRNAPKENAPQPFHGYLFRILTRQGKNAPGGAYDYIINGNMVGGFALVAWPSDYGESGIMTFIINQQGKVYQKDLGSQTESIVQKMKEYQSRPRLDPLGRLNGEFHNNRERTQRGEVQVAQTFESAVSQVFNLPEPRTLVRS